MMDRKNDFDSPWKEVLELYFRQFVAFFFPDAYKDIDWGRPYEFLDTELRQVVRDAIPRKVANCVFSMSNEHQEQGAKARNSRLLQA